MEYLRRREKEDEHQGTATRTTQRASEDSPDTSSERLFLSLPVGSGDEKECGSDDGLTDTADQKEERGQRPLRDRGERVRVVEAHPRKNRRGAKCEKLVPVEVTARTMPQRTTIVGT